MKSIVAFLVLTLSLFAQAQDKDQKPVTLRSILLEQLRTTHNNKDWFVDANTAVSGITAEQASWKDSAGNHSVGQLANHLVFWNQRALAEFKGETPAKFSGNNDETFNAFDAKKWAATVQQLDQVMTDWEKAVEAADEKKLESAASTIAHVGTHNAYHIGQIVIIRKEQGSWDPEKGVK
ncbi:MAG: DinB family protein [Acidobacteriia bacterium]|nr:DinB family protein [Terriglobia bacterium]